MERAGAGVPLGREWLEMGSLGSERVKGVGQRDIEGGVSRGQALGSHGRFREGSDLIDVGKEPHGHSGDDKPGIEQ